MNEVKFVAGLLGQVESGQFSVKRAVIIRGDVGGVKSCTTVSSYFCTRKEFHLDSQPVPAVDANNYEFSVLSSSERQSRSFLAREATSVISYSLHFSCAAVLYRFGLRYFL